MGAGRPRRPAAALALTAFEEMIASAGLRMTERSFGFYLGAERRIGGQAAAKEKMAAMIAQLAL
jgi:hypothetical protein